MRCLKLLCRKRIIIVISLMVFLGVGMFLWQRKSMGFTMKEAYEVAYKEAQKWSEDAYVIQITSTDFHDTENCENGVKGKRNCWSFLFESKKKDVQYAMYIDHGVPTAVQEVRSPGFQAIPMEEISIDTSELYDLARLQGLQGGKDWAFGYHYTLQYTYLNGTDKTPTLTYTIRGINQEEKEEKIIVDPITAKLLFILVKEGYDESGHSIWKKLGEDIEDDIQQLDSVTEVDRETIKEEYEVYRCAATYLVDPEELTDAIIRGINSSRFDPYAEITVYSREDWEERMTELYGDEWKEW